MRMLIRREPLELAQLGRLCGGFFNDPSFGLPTAACGAGERGVLEVDVSEDEGAVIVRASLPGFSKEQVDVEIHDGVLTITAEQKEEKEEKAETYYRKERRVGSVSRRVALPAAVEGEPQGELKDGVLTLRLPKSVRAMPRKVRIG